MTSADLSISHNSLLRLFLSQTTGAWNVVSMEEVQYSIMNQQDSTFKFSFSPKSSRSNINVDVSLFRPVLFEQRNLKDPMSWTACAARLTSGFFTSLSYCLSSLSEETSLLWHKPYSQCGHFEEWVPVLLQGCVCSPVGMQADVKPFGLSSCLPTLWMSSI